MPNKNPSDKRHVGSRAQRAAVGRLITIHAEEYAQILGDEREKLGLPRDRSPQKKKSRLDVLRDQLKQAGVEPAI